MGASSLWAAALSVLCVHSALAFLSPACMNRIEGSGLHESKGGCVSRAGRRVGAPRGGALALRAQFVPSGPIVSAGNPDHPVLKNPVVLNDRFTKERVQIYPNGSTITSYTSGGQDVFFVRPDAVFDGSKPISGGIPLCFPQFGNGDMQQHGFARNLKWTCVDWREDSAQGSRGFSYLNNRASAVFELKSSNYTRAMWPYRFTARYQVDLTAGAMTIDMRVHNRDTKPMEFQVALHSYYAVSDIDKIEIHGNFKGKKYLDKVSGEMKTEDRDVLTINKFTDSVYYGVDGAVELVDGDRSVQIEPLSEWEDVIIWNPYGDAKMGYKNFVCIENGRVENKIQLDPEEWWNSRVQVSPFKNNMPAFMSDLPNQ